MFACTTFSLLLSMFGQVVADTQPSDFTIQPVQVAPAEGPSLYGGETSGSRFANPAQAGASAFAEHSDRGEPRIDRTVPDYGGGFSQRFGDRSPMADSGAPANGNSYQPALPSSAYGAQSAFQQIDVADDAQSLDGQPGIRRTSGNEELNPLRPAELKPAAKLLADGLRSPADGELTGTPIALKDALARVIGTDGQQRAVTAYWELALTLCEFQFAADESLQLDRLPMPATAHQHAVLDAALAAADARLDRAKLAVVQAQHDLAENALMPAGELPLPVDPPFVGSYATHFKTLNDRGAAPDRLRRIDDTLPSVKSLVDSQAAAILASERAVFESGRAYAAGQSGFELVLQMHRELHRQRREFLATVGQYNRDIAQYALTIAGSRGDADRLVGMLIETRPHDTSVWAGNRGAGEIQRVSNEAAISAEPRNTFQR